MLDAEGSFDNANLCSCGMDKCVIYWDVATGKVRKKYRGHAGGCYNAVVVVRHHGLILRFVSNLLLSLDLMIPMHTRIVNVLLFFSSRCVDSRPRVLSLRECDHIRSVLPSGEWLLPHSDHIYYAESHTLQ